ncbi:MAG: NAD-dependent epimerase/dehydratase family protein [Planctomycetota bacterium]
MVQSPATLQPDPVALPENPGFQPSGPTRVALVGAGYIADIHLEALAGLDDVRLVAVCDRDPERAERAARKCGGVPAVTRLEQLQGTGAQVVHLCTPPDTHVDLTRRLLEMGLGVFVEKPLALTEREAHELADFAEARRLPLAVNHNNVFHPAFRRLARKVRAGEIGRLEHVQVTLAVPLRQLDAQDFTHWMFQAPRNIVFEQATHPLSQIHHLLGPAHEVSVTYLGSTELNPGQVFHHRWSVAARAERGTAELYMSFGGPFTRSTLQVLGSDGSLEADLFHDNLSGEEKTLYLDFWNSFLAGHNRGGQLRRDARRSLLRWISSTLGMRPRSDTFFLGMRDSIRAFHESLRDGSHFHGCAENAVQVAAWCDQVAGDLKGVGLAPVKLPPLALARKGEVVVLGATGFIGRQVIRILTERGIPATAVVRRLHTLPPEITAPAQDGKLRVVQASLEKPEQLQKACAGAAAVIHLATGGGDTWEQVERAMVGGSVKVAEVCAEQNIKRFVYVSSIAALYTGADCGSSIIEDSLETDPRPDQRPVYARGKMAAERALLEFQESHDIGLVIIRPGVVLGAGTPMQHSGLGLWARDNHCVGWGDGEHPLPVVLVDDVAEALVRAALHRGPELTGKAMNLCASVPLSARKIVEELQQSTGRRIVFHPRPLALSQAMEIGKWLVKKAGRRKGASFPPYRDLKARSLRPGYSCDIAREVLGWQPVEDPEVFLDRAVRIHG